MAGQRAAKLLPIPFQSGFYTNAADRDATNRWKDGNGVRFHKGLPEKIGGFERITLTGFNNGVYVGIARALHDWTSLDNQQWIAIGTQCKLQLVNNGALYDITPTRKNSNITNPFTTANGTPTITVSDIDHRAEPGDHIYVTSSTAVGGLTISGDYTIVSVTDPNTYIITASGNASSTATGGGGTTISYDISCGLASNGELLGYGTSTYGTGTYGTPRPVGSGVPAKLRTWSLDNWGEDLVGAPSDGELYWWDRSTGSSARAVLIIEAPTNIQRLIVNPENRFIIAIGCSGYDGVADPMRIRWPSQETLDDWIPTDENTAGGKRLDYGSRLITGIKSRGQILIWSDIHLYSMQYLNGDPLGFGFNSLGTCSIVGPNAAADLNGIVRFMGFDDFFIYDGTLRIMPCDVHTYVFGDFDRTQAEKVVCSTYRPKGETRWDYASESGTGENDRYVIHNSFEDCWYYGSIVRTAYRDVSAAITGYMTNPYGANGGYLYKHEQGTDFVDGSTTVMPWFIESYDMNVGGSDFFGLINSLIPNYDSITGEFSLTLKKKRWPQSAYETRGPYTVTGTTEKIDVRSRGSQTALRLSNGTATGQSFRMGIWQALVTPYGGR